MTGAYAILAAFALEPGPIAAPPIDYIRIDYSGVVIERGVGHGWVHFAQEDQTCDLNRDGYVNGDDYDLFIMVYQRGSLAADFDGNGFVNGDDLDLFEAVYQAGGR